MRNPKESKKEKKIEQSRQTSIRVNIKARKSLEVRKSHQKCQSTRKL